MVKLSSSSFSVKWAGPNAPLVKFVNSNTDERFVLTKRDLLLIYREIGEFMNFYSDDFTGSNLDQVLDEYVDQTDD